MKMLESEEKGSNLLIENVPKVSVDWDSFVIPSERGQHVDEYMREMRRTIDNRNSIYFTTSRKVHVGVF